MSRKSLPKKDQIIWYLCSKCNSNIYVKDRDQHSEDCPNIESSACTLIRDKQLRNAQLNIQTITEDLRGLNARHVSNLVFLSESVFGLCELVLGDNVLISSDALPNGVPIIRSAWPSTSGSSPTVASVSEEELRKTWNGRENALVSIQKLSRELIPAAVITLTVAAGSEEIDQKVWKDVQKVLAVQLKGKIYCRSNVVTITFFNKSFSFTISDLIAVNDTSDGAEVASLIEKFKSINIAQQSEYFLVTGSTRLEFDAKDSQPEGAESFVERVIPKLDLIGGMDDVIRDVRKYMDISFGNIKMSSSTFVPRAILLHGQHGCGKTLLCDAITESTDALVIKINAADLFSKYFGETETNLRSHFEKAFKHYPRPSIVVIEELSSICPKETKEESAKRVQLAFLNVMDDIHRRQNASRLFVLVTTSNIDNVNLAVRRYGRLDVEIEIPVPDAITREQILIKQLQQTKHNMSDDEVKTIATNSHGYIAADLSNLIAKASLHASNADGDCVISMADVQYAYGHVVPSAMKEVVIKCPNVKWSDIGGQDELKLQLKQAIEWPLLHPEAFARMGIAPPRGILMFGPPGCSKTMIAKALATESKVNFLSIKGPELFSMWVGESERAVRDLFHKARQVAPAIIFFDEIDAIGGERSASASGSSVKERVLTQLLTEMDGVNALTNVTIVAATNRPDLIDKAIMRPGRLDRIVYVRLPEEKTRAEIFRIKLAKMPVANDVQVATLVERTDGYSGAEIQAVCQEAAMYALEESLSATVIGWSHFTKALENVRPRTSPDLLQLYEDYLLEKMNK